MAVAKTDGSFMGARALNGVGAAANESIMVRISFSGQQHESDVLRCRPSSPQTSSSSTNAGRTWGSTLVRILRRLPESLADEACCPACYFSGLYLGPIISGEIASKLGFVSSFLSFDEARSRRGFSQLALVLLGVPHSPRRQHHRSRRRLPGNAFRRPHHYCRCRLRRRPQS